MTPALVTNGADAIRPLPDWLELCSELIHELTEAGVSLELGPSASVPFLSHHDAVQIVVEGAQPVLLQQLQTVIETEAEREVRLHGAVSESLDNR